MEFLDKFLPILFMLVVIPSTGVLTAFVVSFIRAKKEELKKQIDNDLLKKYVDMLSETVCSCVIATNQTYVNELKRQGKFDLDAQKEAFRKTYEAVMSILSEDAVKYLTVFYGDLQTTITELIEQKVFEENYMQSLDK